MFWNKKKDISEPILSFVEVVKNSPDRFKMRREWCDHYQQPLYVLLDNVTKETYKFYINWYDSSILPSEKLEWLTPDEIALLKRVLTNYFNIRAINLELLKTSRKNRMFITERNKYIKMYCK
jgi:hypothetical protein